MKLKMVCVAALTAVVVLTGCDKITGGKSSGDVALPDTLTTQTDRISYSIGVLMASNLKQQGLDSLDMNIVKQAMSAVFADEPLRIEAMEANQEVSAFFQKKAEADQLAEQEKHKGNIAKGEAFLEENKTKEGVQVTPSGLQYKIIEEGSGKKPAPTDMVKVHYHGTLLSGDVFDSSVDRGQPVDFPVNQVIPGWTEALQLMKEGGKMEVWIPYNLAYGERGAGEKIKPYSTLVFTIELLEVSEAPAQQGQPQIQGQP